MTGLSLARRGSIAAAGGDTGEFSWMSEMEFFVDFRTKALDSNINGMTADTGQTITSNPGADTEATGQIVDSPIDSQRVLRVLDVDSDTSYTHNTVTFSDRIVFEAFMFRFDEEGETDYSVLAQIAWENWAANNSTTASPNHVLHTRAATVAQTYSSLAATTQVTHTYSVEFGTETQYALAAIDPVAGAVVILCPDGEIISYAVNLASTLEPETSDHEFGRIVPTTDTFAEILTMGASTLEGMTDAVFDAYDALLVTQGYGSAYEEPPPAIEQIAVQTFASANQDPTPAAATVSINTGTGVNRVAIAYMVVTAQSTAGALSGHTRTATLGSVTMTSKGAAYVNAETDAPGYWIEAFVLEDLASHSLTSSQTFDIQVSKASENYRIRGGVLVYSGVSSVDAAAVQTGTGATNPTMSIASAVDDVVLFGIIAEAAAQTSGYDGSVQVNHNYSGGPYPNAPLLVEQLPGATTVSDTVTRGTASSDWASIGLNLNKAV